MIIYEEAVSVIVPVHNMELHLDQCISSIELQRYENLEIICVNSCSTDNSATIIKRAMLRDSRIRHIHQETDAGLGGSRNEGSWKLAGNANDDGGRTLTLSDLRSIWRGCRIGGVADMRSNMKKAKSITKFKRDHFVLRER